MRARERDRIFQPKLNTIFSRFKIIFKKDFFSKKGVRGFISLFIFISLLGVLHILI